jgi:3-methyladenine DNA glycosylase/8-oxoguanine DNA glycosylase
VALETLLRPRPPYSLALSARLAGDATRHFRDGVLTAVFEAGRGSLALARVEQKADGTLAVQLESREPEAALDHLRFVLAADDDHSEFLERFRDDRLLAQPIRLLRGLRPLRAATVTHALLKAVCGQLIDSRSARDLEYRLVRLTSEQHAGLRLPPRRTAFQRFTPPELARHGLVSRKAYALLRTTRGFDPERLRDVETETAARRIERERGLGPWSAGMVCLYGLGRFERGLVGDLGLMKLCSALLGRWAEPEDTAELLLPYGDWAGLASIYLLHGQKGSGKRAPSTKP